MDDGERGQPSKPEQSDTTKVGRVIKNRSLTGIGEQLESRWLGVESERQSLRNLADYFNCRVLETALREAGEQPLNGEIENQYRLLTGDDVSASGRAQVETQLERLGIDVESLREDFVTHQAIHTYLTDVREVSLPDDEQSADDVIESKQGTIMRLRNRLVAVTEQSIESLRNGKYLSLGEFEIIVSINIYCNDCKTSYEIAELLRRRACECPETMD